MHGRPERGVPRDSRGWRRGAMQPLRRASPGVQAAKENPPVAAARGGFRRRGGSGPRVDQRRTLPSAVSMDSSTKLEPTWRLGPKRSW